MIALLIWRNEKERERERRIFRLNLVKSSRERLALSNLEPAQLLKSDVVPGGS